MRVANIGVDIRITNVSRRICSCIYFNMLFYLLHYMVVKYGTLKIAKLLKIYIMISSDRLSSCEEYPYVYVTCRIGTSLLTAVRTIFIQTKKQTDGVSVEYFIL